VVQRRAGALGLGAVEVGARLVDRILLQDDALLDRGDRSAFRRDRGLVLRDGRLVIARVDRKKSGWPALTRSPATTSTRVTTPPRSMASAITSLAGSTMPAPATSLS
jgi:hypothetical protein